MPRAAGSDQITIPMHCGLPVLLWVIQFMTITVYIYAITFLVAAMAAKGDLGALGPSYLTILIFFLLILLLLSNEAVFLLRRTLTPTLYLNSQIVKTFFFITTLLSIEVFGLAWKRTDVSGLNGTLGGIIDLTLLASIPFTLSLALAWFMQRERRSGIAIVVTGVDVDVDVEQGQERRPLLPDRYHTA
ncbi:hypothetical protein MBM_00669 [Drepanopeziza brunnea f. sp. 'multigermtubi' MB_m1]|uniref:Uncharacterized protein n=1 Tax=Marssonina brunnea f. sp. multigermtubi (strain MB_m1) TaxID=1072389 RepID=K1X8X7_MARBU|nr:uncharacterized protein MBM_00669 [Drepanopeziza brunnea f. sp. 'multigermtubi' MB_m1]EKD21556.1 hypothetical protein MBM_00669 [Drepanopeziza brunnea f. sp. 'multigermtubi' MB_m1]